ncbi:hydrogenase maturation protease [Microbulbifer aggregans]|uniref:hydrogenase maturation protease n=1 Tax=Microbulbifer aggregans TaxID=1769779 RepID=UPI001CFF18C2|nr:hydrogenase maturation protease [Microbulbifer aggregans]
MNKWVVISLGNRFRGDDSVGPYILNRLRDQVGHMAECIENGGDIGQLLDDWKQRCVCLVDAVMDQGGRVGDIVRIDGLSEDLPQNLSTTSSHGLSLVEAIELGKTLDALPHHLAIYAICGENFAISAGLSPAVKAAATTVEQEIVELLNRQEANNARAIPDPKPGR